MVNRYRFRFFMVDYMLLFLDFHHCSDSEGN